MRRLMRVGSILSVLFTSMYAWADDVVMRFPATDWQPFSIGKSAPFSGIDIDIARLVAKQMNWVLELQSCPFKRCLRQIEVGTLDMISGVAFNEERARYMDYIQNPYGQVSVAFYVRKGRADRIQAYEDLAKYTVGMVRGSHYFEPFNSDDKLRKYEAATESVLLPMLEAGRLETVIGTNPNLDYQILQAGFKGRFEPAHYDPQKQVSIYFAFSKNSPLLRYKDKVAAILKQMAGNGTLEEIYAKYR